jgi:hypothetical protein
MFSNVQEQEEINYRIGCFSNESQAAFSLSQRTLEYPQERKRVADLVAQGRHVVVFHYTVTCPHTDAVVGQATQYIADYATFTEAQADHFIHAGDDYDPDFYYEVCSPAEAVVTVTLDLSDSDEVPF